MRKLNFKFLLVLVGITIVLTGGIVLAHHLQYKRIPTALLHQAERAEQEGDLQRATMYLSRYLEFAPDDAEQWGRLGWLLADSKVFRSYNAKRRALFVLLKAIAKDPARHDLRQKTIVAALDLNRLNDAKEHLAALPTGTPSEVGVKAALEGRYYEAEKNFTAALQAYQLAVKNLPKKPNNYLKVAELLRAQRYTDLPPTEARTKLDQNAAKADTLIFESMIANNPDSWEAHVGRWNYLRAHHARKMQPTWKGLQEAATGLQRALEMAPGQPEVRLASAELAQFRGNLKEAREHLDKALQLHRKDPRIYRAYAGLELHSVVNETDKAKKEEGQEKARSWLRLGIQQLKGPAQFEVLWAYATLLLDQGDTEALREAESAITQIRQANASGAGVNFLQARLLFNRQQWAEAAKLFERARPVLEASPDLATQIDILLGRCYIQLDAPKEQYKTYQRLALRDPSSTLAHYGMATAARALGQLTDAMTHYRKLMELPEAPRGIWGERAHILIAQARQSTAGNRWTAIEQMLARREANLKLISAADDRKLAEIELAIIQAEFHLAQGATDKAHLVLEQATKKHPDRVEPWIALSSLLQREEKLDRALDVLDSAEKHMKRSLDQIELRLARARAYVKLNDKDAKQRLSELSRSWQKFPPVEQSRLLNGLAESHYRVGNLTEASRLWTHLTTLKEYQGDLRLRLVLFDVALQQNDDQEMRRILTAIKKLEGGEGAFSRHAQALHLIWQAGQVKDETELAKKLDRADQLLNQVKESRPGWPAVFLAKAQIEESRGNPAAAIDHYKEARRLGDRNPLVVRQLVEALRKQNRFREADREMRSLSPQDLLGSDLGRLAAIVSLENHDPTRAAWWASRTVHSQSSDFKDHLWLGQVLMKSGQSLDKAEEHLKQAVRLGASQPETWLALVEFLAEQKGDQVQAVLKLKEAEKNLPKEKADLALARGYELLNKEKEAEHHFKRALKSLPESPLVLKRVAQRHLMQSRLKDAEPLLRRLADLRSAEKTDAQWARWNLALVLSSGEDYPRFVEGLKLTGLELDADGKVVESTSPGMLGDAIQTMRIQARVLATQPGWKTRDAAISRLEALEKRSSLDADEQFILAQLYHSRGDWQKAHQQLMFLSRRKNVAPQHLAFFAQTLLAHSEVQEAKRVLTRLQQIQMKAPSRPVEIALAELNARWHEANGEPDKALEQIEARLKEPSSRAEEILLLVHFHARRKEYAEAQKLLDRVWKDCAVEVASGATVALLRATSSNQKQRAAVIARLEQALIQHPRNATLHVQMGDVHDLSGDYDKAEASYRQALKLDPTNVMALNNLAWLLAHRDGQAKEAEQLINNAIEVVGPRGQLLDTRAMVYLKLGKPKEAERDLTDAIQEKQTATRSFHLARVSEAVNDRSKVIRYLQEAQAQKLQVSQLHPVEQRALTEMLQKYMP